MVFCKINKKRHKNVPCFRRNGIAPLREKLRYYVPDIYEAGHLFGPVYVALRKLHVITRL